MTAISSDVTSRESIAQVAASAGDVAGRASLTAAVQKYFDLMYDCDTSRLDEVFLSTALLHGFRDGRMMSWSMEVYKDILDKRQSPKSLSAPRADEIVQMDFASADMAFVKARVRIAAMHFVDYLTWHRIDNKWLITSKGFYLQPGDGGKL
jgi:putative lumazine-binding protein